MIIDYTKKSGNKKDEKNQKNKRMESKIKKILKTMLILSLLLLFGQSRGGVIRFVGIVYDVVTYASVPGKTVSFELRKTEPFQLIQQQNYSSNSMGEVITADFNLTDSVWYSYRLSLTDCNNDTVTLFDSLLVSGHDTLFLYLGICHSVSPGNCKSKFTYSPDSFNPFIYQFTNTSTGSATGYQWSFGDGTTSALKNPVKQYLAPGAYLVCLTVYDSLISCQDSWCDVVNITQGVIIHAVFSAQLDSFALTPRLLNFHDLSFSNIPLNHYVWSFGDGHSAQIQDPIHIYQQSGQYQVCLMAGYAGGLHDSACEWVNIPDYFDLWGQVLTAGLPSASGKVLLLNPLYTPNGFAVAGESSIASPGLFFFPQRIEHPYLLRAFPDSGSIDYLAFLPTYSGNTIFWKQAATLMLQSNISNYDISLVKKKNPGTGICQVSGAVMNQSPLQLPTGTLVILLDNTDESPVAYTWPDSTGFYSLNQLPYGSYTLVAEYPGLDATKLLIDLSPQNPTLTGAQLYLSPVTGVPGPDKAPIWVTCQPNPATTTLHLAIPSGTSPRELFIYNDVGQQVGCQRLENAGVNDFAIDVSGLNAGVYSITVNTKTGTGRVRFVKVE
jgi:hypothetical protein